MEAGRVNACGRWSLLDCGPQFLNSKQNPYSPPVSFILRMKQMLYGKCQGGGGGCLLSKSNKCSHCLQTRTPTTCQERFRM